MLIYNLTYFLETAQFLTDFGPFICGMWRQMNVYNIRNRYFLRFAHLTAQLYFCFKLQLGNMSLYILKPTHVAQLWWKINGLSALKANQCTSSVLFWNNKFCTKAVSIEIQLQKSSTWSLFSVLLCA